MGLFGGGDDDKDKEEKEETYIQKAFAQVGDYLFSLVVPVAILLYVAPQKSLQYIVDNAKDQVSAITEFEPEVAWNATKDLFDKTVPILVMEGEVISSALDQVADYIIAAYNSPWIELINWQYALIALAVLGIFFYMLPWGKVIDWVAQSAWRTVMLFVGVLPLDDGLDTISDQESGTYEIVMVGGSILLTLAINYAVLWAAWWVTKKATLIIFRQIIKLVKRALAKPFEIAWTATKAGFRKVFKRGKREEEIKEE